jgi:hypothetical protein
VRKSTFDKFKIPVDNTVFFAGEHTSGDFRGTTHGAYASGVQAAKDIIANAPTYSIDEDGNTVVTKGEDITARSSASTMPANCCGLVALVVLQLGVMLV